MVSAIGPLFFSRIVVRRALRDPYAVHQLVWNAFPEGERAFLYRADRVVGERGVRFKVLVQALTEANWSRVGDGIDEAEQVRREISANDGDRFRFFLRANPTKRVAVKGEIGARVGLVREEHQLEWLARKAEAGGFAVVGVRVSNRRPWRWSRGETKARHDGVDFEGVLEVVDSARFGPTLIRGIGSAKAFGFGLLSLARIDR